jgi:hypothetical protein
MTTAPDAPPPLSRSFDLNRLSEAGYETTIEAGPEDRGKLAEWADVIAVNRFVGSIVMHRLSSNRFAYEAHLEADIEQACAVSLEPVFSNIAMDFTRELHLVPHVKKVIDISGELSSAAGDDAVPEEIDSPRYDIAAPLLEEFLLAIDPYPKAQGANLDLPDDAAAKPENPFAVLKGLKT